jgi:hypothetical protein
MFKWTIEPPEHRASVDDLSTDVLHQIMRGVFFHKPSDPPVRICLKNMPESLVLHFVCHAWSTAATMTRDDLLVTEAMLLYNLPTPQHAHIMYRGTIPVERRDPKRQFGQMFTLKPTGSWIAWYYRTYPRQVWPFKVDQIARSNDREAVHLYFRERTSHVSSTVAEHSMPLLLSAAAHGSTVVMEECGFSAKTCDKQTYARVISCVVSAERIALADEIAETFEARHGSVIGVRELNGWLGSWCNDEMRAWVRNRKKLASIKKAKEKRETAKKERKRATGNSVTKRRKLH